MQLFALEAIARAAQGLSDAETLGAVVDKVVELSAQLDQADRAITLATLAITLGKLGGGSF